MSDRQPNEVLISSGLLEKFLSQGGSRVLSVQSGSSPDAKLVGVEWQFNFGNPLVVLIYDRDVPEPWMRYEYELEKKLVAHQDLVAAVRKVERRLRNNGFLAYADPLRDALAALDEASRD